MDRPNGSEVRILSGGVWVRGGVGAVEGFVPGDDRMAEQDNHRVDGRQDRELSPPSEVKTVWSVGTRPETEKTSHQKGPLLLSPIHIGPPTLVLRPKPGGSTSGPEPGH